MQVSTSTMIHFNTVAIYSIQVVFNVMLDSNNKIKNLSKLFQKGLVRGNDSFMIVSAKT